MGSLSPRPMGCCTAVGWRHRPRVSLNHLPAMHDANPTAARTPIPKVIAWEVTRRCALQCQHCRGAARNEDYQGEFTTEECRQVIDSIASFAKPILILTGGEPMSRPDIFQIARYATDRGLYPVMAPCGHLITPETARQMVEAGIKAISISIDGATPESHDSFRGVPGAYERTLQGLELAKAAGIKFQINTTVTKKNLDELPQILEKAISLGAMTWDTFFLVPTGRGSAIRDLEIAPVHYEKTLRWIYKRSQDSPIRIKTTCAPHYARIQQQERGKAGRPTSPPPAAHGHGHHGPPPQGGDPNYVSGGCMAGDGFVFISHRGILQTCGFLDVNCGDLRAASYNFKDAYLESLVFNQIRDRDNYEGKCGCCEFRSACGGCRARAYARTGDYLAEEPGCVYVPEVMRPTRT